MTNAWRGLLWARATAPNYPDHLISADELFATFRACYLPTRNLLWKKISYTLPIECLGDVVLHPILGGLHDR
jgi:hypothetical protein